MYEFKIRIPKLRKFKIRIPKLWNFKIRIPDSKVAYLDFQIRDVKHQDVHVAEFQNPVVLCGTTRPTQCILVFKVGLVVLGRDPPT